MNIGGIILMTVSWLTIIALMVFCFGKVLRK